MLSPLFPVIMGITVRIRFTYGGKLVQFMKV